MPPRRALAAALLAALAACALCTQYDTWAYPDVTVPHRKPGCGRNGTRQFQSSPADVVASRAARAHLRLLAGGACMCARCSVAWLWWRLTAWVCAGRFVGDTAATSSFLVQLVTGATQEHVDALVHTLHDLHGDGSAPTFHARVLSAHALAAAPSTPHLHVLHGNFSNDAVRFLAAHEHVRCRVAPVFACVRTCVRLPVRPSFCLSVFRFDPWLPACLPGCVSGVRDRG